MELYILDSLFRRVSVVDRFMSLIWTERFHSVGDFELVMHSTLENRRAFINGTLLATNESHRIMVVSVVQNATDNEGNALLTVKGLSLESILEDRVAKNVLSDLTTSPKWVITDTPADIARKIFHDICVTGILDNADIIPFITEGTIMPDDTIDEPTDVITVELDPTTVYTAIKDICETWSLGFRILRNGDSSQLYFDIYAGNDRTTGQTILEPVVFSPELDNLQNTTELNTTVEYKNVAYVFSEVGYEVVYPPGIVPEMSGFERHVLLVKADDVTVETLDISTALIQRGLEALSKQRSYFAFDGEINQNSQYKYGTHYFLGDLVETQSSSGAIVNTRVTEQIFVSDAEGERSYPTLANSIFIDTGSWLSWMATQVWQDMGLTEYWENM